MIIYEVVSVLRGAGVDAAVVVETSGGRYPDAPKDIPVFYNSLIGKSFARRYGGTARIRDAYRRARAQMGGRNCDPIRITPEDVLVLAERFTADGCCAFPDNPKIIFAQNQFTHLMQLQLLSQLGVDPKAAISATISAGPYCTAVAERIGFSPVIEWPVAPRMDDYPFVADKSLQVSFMPRKRTEEAWYLEQVLRSSPVMAGVEIVQIEGKPPDQVRAALAQSLVFVSLARRESIGFPALEAMAAGCLVVGYTGVGGQVYLTSETGFPVADGDIDAAADAVLRVVEAYKTAPAPLDTLRQSASVSVHRAYSSQRFADSVRASWPRLVAAAREKTAVQTLHPAS